MMRPPGTLIIFRPETAVERTPKDRAEEGAERAPAWAAARKSQGSARSAARAVTGVAGSWRCRDRAEGRENKSMIRAGRSKILGKSGDPAPTALIIFRAVEIGVQPPIDPFRDAIQSAKDREALGHAKSPEAYM